MPELPIAEQVAGLDPAMAANRPQASTTATPSPPGTRCSHVCKASYRSLPARDLPIAAPFRMKSGIVNKVMLANSSVHVLSDRIERSEGHEGQHENRRDPAERESDRNTKEQHAKGSQCIEAAEL